MGTWLTICDLPFLGLGFWFVLVLVNLGRFRSLQMFTTQVFEIASCLNPQVMVNWKLPQALNQSTTVLYHTSGRMYLAILRLEPEASDPKQLPTHQRARLLFFQKLGFSGVLCMQKPFLKKHCNFASSTFLEVSHLGFWA